MFRTRRMIAEHLRSAPMVDIAHLVDAGDRTVRRTTLLRQELPLYVGALVVGQRHTRITPLLRAVVHQPKLTDIQVPSPSAATPVVRLSVRNCFLEMIET